MGRLSEGDGHGRAPHFGNSALSDPRAHVASSISKSFGMFPSHCIDDIPPASATSFGMTVDRSFGSASSSATSGGTRTSRCFDV